MVSAANALLIGSESAGVRFVPDHMTGTPDAGFTFVA